MKANQQINQRGSHQNYSTLGAKKGNYEQGYGNYKISPNKKSSNEPNYRARIFKYFQYVVDNANMDKSYRDMKIISSSLDVQKSSPLKKIRREESIKNNVSLISSEQGIKVAKEKRKKRIGDKISQILNEEEEKASALKLPPISKKNDVEQNQRGQDWKKYYNEHNLQTVKLDELTISKIESNQKGAKMKHRVSMS